MTAVFCAWFLGQLAGDRQAARSTACARSWPRRRRPSPATRAATLVAEKAGRLIAARPRARNRDRVGPRPPRDLARTAGRRLARDEPPGERPASSSRRPRPTPHAGGAFAITGRTYSHDGVARLLSRLSVVPNLELVKLEKSIVGTRSKAATSSSSRSRRPARGTGDLVTKQRSQKPAAIALVVAAPPGRSAHSATSC